MDQLLQLDLGILQFLQLHLRNDLTDGLFLFITRLGDLGLFWILLGVILLIRPKYRPWGVCLLCGLAFSSLLGEGLLKHLVERTRPCVAFPIQNMLLPVPHTFSFPSGHTMSSFTAATILWQRDRKTGAAALLLAGLIGFSRLFLYVHYPSDVLAGLILGVGCGLLSHWFFFRSAPGTQLLQKLPPSRA